MTKLFVTGSIIAYATHRSIVWGAGILYRDDPVSVEATLLAVRGPLSRARAHACGVPCPDVYGDPALLLPRLYSPRQRERHGVGLVAHFSDKPRLVPPPPESGVRLIDVQSPVESFVDEVASCEAVASSSLHGLIVSHAYGIPAIWVKFRDLPSGDDSKFHDYYSSIAETSPQLLRLDVHAISADLLAAHARVAPEMVDVDRLWDACPFR